MLNLCVSKELVVMLCSILGRNKHYVSKSSCSVRGRKEKWGLETQLKGERTSEVKTMGLLSLYLVFLLIIIFKNVYLFWGAEREGESLLSAQSPMGGSIPQTMRS